MNTITSRSNVLTEQVERTAHRALLFALGLNREDFARPKIAVVNSWNEIVPGCIHLRSLSEKVKQGIARSGGIPFEFNTIGICDGLAQGHLGMHFVLPSREIIASSIELMLQAHQFDAAVFISSCDKITPGMLMAAARVNIPSIFLPAGSMEPGEAGDRKITLSTMREFAGKHLAGELSLQELYKIEEMACPGAGTCSMMGTANTMACLCEALGMALPGSATALAVGAEKSRQAFITGERIVDVLKERLLPSSILTTDAFFNAVKVDMAIGGSTNAILHLPAIAHELGIHLQLDDIDQISRTTPYLACINPSGPQTISDFHRAGGIPAIIRTLLPRLAPDARTVEGGTIKDIAAKAVVRNTNVIQPLESPIAQDGGVAILKGNLAPNGALVKKSAVSKQMWKHRGPAQVFDSMEDAIDAAKSGLITPGSVIVIRYEGPAGGPGMREMHMITSLICGMGLANSTALVTDGRFSGSTRGPCIGHISPEASAGGPIALVTDGDMITIDIGARKLELEVSVDILEQRGKHWKPNEPKITSGYLKLYSRLVSSADQGAILK